MQLSMCKQSNGNSASYVAPSNEFLAITLLEETPLLSIVLITGVTSNTQVDFKTLKSSVVC